MSISSFESAGSTSVLEKSYNIQLAVLLFLVVLDQLVTPFVWNFSEYLSYSKKEKLWYSPLSSVLSNLVQVWTFSFIGLITWFDWKICHNELTMWFPKGRYRKPGSYIFDFVLGGRGDWIRKIWSDTVLLWYVVYEKVYDSAPNFVWIDLRVSRSWDLLFCFLSTVFFIFAEVFHKQLYL